MLDVLSFEKKVCSNTDQSPGLHILKPLGRVAEGKGVRGPEILCLEFYDRLKYIGAWQSG